MVEWFKAAVLKTAEGRPSVGSNPTSSAIFFAQKKWRTKPHLSRRSPWDEDGRLHFTVPSGTARQKPELSD